MKDFFRLVNKLSLPKDKKFLPTGLLLFLMGLSVLFSGCTLSKRQVRQDLNLANPPAYSQYEPRIEKPFEGSLWPGEGKGTLLFSNLKARTIGDSLTIIIDEASQASKQATTKTGRNSSLNAGISNFLGLEAGRVATNNRFNPDKLLSTNFASDFEGSGATSSSGKLVATMTALIKEVLPNGNFLIEGRRIVKVNNEDQYIVLTGIVRPRDISPDNTVRSTFIAEASIEYGGSGLIAEKQNQGWLGRLIDSIWPF